MLNELRQSFRALRHAKGFSIVAVATLALGIGANTALFCVADAVLLRPLPYPAPDRLVAIDGAPMSFNSRTALGLRKEVQESAVFTATGTYESGAVNVGGEGGAERVRAAAVSARFLEVLGAGPVVGRVPTADDLKKDVRQAVISHALWLRRGRIKPGGEILVNGRAFVVVGVMPDRVDFPGAADIWIPTGSDHQIAGSASAPATIGRLAPGVTADGARLELERIADAAGRGVRDSEEQPIRVLPLHDDLVASVRPLFLTLAIAVALVLLVACINTASLLLVRVSAREREIAARRALGASGLRLVRHLLCESALLSVCAGILAIPAAVWTLGAIRAALPVALHGSGHVVFNVRALLATGFLCATTTLLFGTAPVWWLRRAGGVNVLRGISSSTVDPFWRRFRGVLVIAELAIALVLIAGAATVGRTVSALMRVDLGVSGERALTVETALPLARYDSPERLAAFHEQLETAVRGIPGVEAVGATNQMPGTPQMAVGRRIMVEGRPAPQRAQRGATCLSASTDYFRAIGIPLVAGRYFTRADGPRAQLVAIVSESVARRVGLPPAEAIGRRVEVGLGRPSWATIVGVVRDVRLRGPEADPGAQLYVPLAQQPNFGTTFIVVKALGNPARLAPPLRAAIGRIDSDVPLYNIRTFEQVRTAFLPERRFAMAMMSAFGLLTGLLAGIGMYGMLSYLVELRTPEIGIRMALGASPGAVRSAILWEGVLHGLAAVTIGAGASAVLLRAMTTHVPGLQPPDPRLLALTAGAMLIAVIPVTWLPARRATTIDPIHALRAE